MVTLLERIEDEMSAASAEDLREINERIWNAEAVIHGLKAERDRMTLYLEHKTMHGLDSNQAEPHLDRVLNAAAINEAVVQRQAEGGAFDGPSLNDLKDVFAGQSSDDAGELSQENNDTFELIQILCLDLAFHVSDRNEGRPGLIKIDQRRVTEEMNLITSRVFGNRSCKVQPALAIYEATIRRCAEIMGH